MKPLLILSITLFVSFEIFGQTPKEKAEYIAAEFNKEKHKYKKKLGQITEVHLKVEAKPDYQTNKTAYKATYELEGLNQFIVLTQDTSYEWQADFAHKQEGKLVSFGKLLDIKIEDAFLSGKLILNDGKEQTFEAVFINRIVNDEPASKGLAFNQKLLLSNEMIVEKVFYKRQE